MSQSNLLPPSCQSCGIPLKHPSEFGTTGTGVIATDYCGYCLQNGNYTEPKITLEGMIERVAKTLAEKQGISVEQAREMAASMLPGLDRWKEKH
jgi:hypothetical protein